MRLLTGIALTAVAATTLSAPGYMAPASSMAFAALAMSGHMGWEVDRATGAGTCSGNEDTCLSRKPSSQPGGFEYPSALATDPTTGELYVADLDNKRVQKFTQSGEFIAMFGWDVNRTKVKARAARAQRDICTAASQDVCGAGVSGGEPGQLSYPFSLAVDPLTGAVYVLETGASVRVDKYTRDGRFVWMVGKGVNRTTGGNLCSEREVHRSAVRCGMGAGNDSNSLQPGALKSAQQDGNLLAAGGPEHLVYVGDEHRVQEFDADGRWMGEILLASLSAEPNAGVGALALAPGGELYAVYRVPSRERGPPAELAATVRRFDMRGEQIGAFPVYARQAGALVHIDGIAIDPAGDMAVIGVEVDVANGSSLPPKRFGFIYDAATGRLLGEFEPPRDNDGLTFDSEGDLYVAAADNHEVVAYTPVPPGRLCYPRLLSSSSWILQPLPSRCTRMSR